MEESISRRAAVKGGLAIAAGAVVSTSAVAQNSNPPHLPKLPDALVHDYVVAGHHDLDLVKKMLADQPRLLNACWDWGNGDFEMAIGGAGHMGRKDIAEYIISQGGRYDLFVAAMMDEIEVVGPILKAHPELAKSLGPHGIPLVVHAQHGQAIRVLELINSLG